jgi:REP element-mobilizing transposase RayT
MARPLRVDSEGMWHHVWDRAIAGKPIFENPGDILRFLAAVACAVHREDIEVHAFVVMDTHFHLLIRSLKGTLSEAMARILADYTCYYNRTRGRDGTVWRGRFSSKPVLTLRYRSTLLRYIDQNPVVAKMANVPWEYPTGSAVHFVNGTCEWLCRTWVETEVRCATGRPLGDPGAYERLYSPQHAEEIARFVEARETSCADGPDPLDDLMRMTPPGVREWLAAKSLLADGMRPGHPVVCASVVQDHCARREAQHGDFDVRPNRNRQSAMRSARIALLRDLSGETFAQIAARVGLSGTRTVAIYRDHARLVVADDAYADLVVELTLAVLDHCRAYLTIAA